MDVGFQKAQRDNLPHVTGEMIAHFFEKNRDFVSSEIRGTKAERSARDTYGDNAVGYVQVKREGSMCTVKGRVTPEHRVRKKGYSVSLKCNEQEKEIITVECESCAAHKGGCKHIIAFVFWIHRRSSEPSTTEVTNYWMKSKLSAIGTSQKFVLARDIGRKVVPDLPPTDYSVLEEFMDTVQKDNVSDFQLCNYFSPNVLKQKLSLHLLKLNFVSQSLGSTVEEFLEYIISNTDKELCNEAETASGGQASTPMWHELRYGRITASKLYEAAHCSTVDGCLVESILGARFRATAAMERGSKLERKVIKILQRKHKTKIHPCGLLLDPRFPIFGASPDGLTQDFVVEVKCPMSDKALDRYFQNDQPTAKHNAQIQLQMMFAEKDRGLFCVALPTFEKDGAVKEMWVNYDKDFCENAISKALQFWSTAIFPRL